jgi:hypothetical protein
MLHGIITKYNRKSVTVITENGQHWNVAPMFLRKAGMPSRAQTPSGQVIRLPKK